MQFLLNILFFLLPFAIYAVWRQFNPEADPNPRLVLLALIGIGLAVAGSAWYGLSVSHPPETVYVPAYIDEQGNIVPGRMEPRR